MTNTAAAGSSPIDIIVIGFEGNYFNGAIAPELKRLTETNTVRLVDLVFVRKDAAGGVTSLTGEELASGAASDFPDAELVQPGALGIDDVSEVGDDLAEQSSALIIAFENTWAGAFVSAVRESNGEVLSFTRIPSDLAQTTLDQSAGGTEAD
ncbi:MAG: DUF6325 family protein [Ornithinimicrobium sp.]